MGGAVCRCKPEKSNDRARLLDCQLSISQSEDPPTRQAQKLIVDAPSACAADPELPVLKSLGDSVAMYNMRSHADSTMVMGAVGGGQRSALANTRVRPSLSSRSSSGSSMPSIRSLPDEIPTGARGTTPAMGPNTTPSMPAMSGSMSSTCSAFSLYSASSPVQQLPQRSLLPFDPQAPLRAASKRSTPCAPQLDAPSAAAAASKPATECLVTQTCPGNSVSSTTISEDKIPERGYGQNSANVSVTPPSMTSAATPMLAVSNALLDVSFDSRVFAVNEATTSTEIDRLGNRLRELQQGKFEFSFPRSSLALESSGHSDHDSASRTHSSVLGESRAMGEAGPGASTPSSDLSMGSERSSLSDHGLRSEQLHTEAAKFVRLIQEIQRMRTSGRPGYTWFRWKTVLPLANPGNTSTDSSSGEGSRFFCADDYGHSETEVEGCVESSSSPSLVPEQAPSFGDGKERVLDHSAPSDMFRRSLFCRRNRLSRSVHWLPFEMHESDAQADSSRTPTCFCGYQAKNVLVDGAGSACGHEYPPETEVDDGKSNAHNLLHSGFFAPAVAPETETPPLPSVVPHIDRNPLYRDDVDSDNCLSDWNKHLSSSADTSASESAHSCSTESLSFCPVHILYTPLSILVPKTEKRTSNTRHHSATRISQSETLQVNVPATFATHLIPSSLRSADSTAVAPQHSVDEESKKGGGGRRPIIHVGVPHRKQLAKRALEDNRLFFEMPSGTRNKCVT